MARKPKPKRRETGCVLMLVAALLVGMVVVAEPFEPGVSPLQGVNDGIE